MAVLEDIAEQAGVSVSTVSRALQNDKRISISTRQRIVSIANELGYTKHKVKRNQIQDWDAVGIIVPEVISGYYAQLVHIAHDGLAKRQLSAVVKITNFRQDAMIRNIENFSRLNIKCLLIIVDDSEEISTDVLSAVSIIQTPVMFITSKYFSNLDYDSIYIDEQRGIANALEYLVEKGYHRIGFVGEEQTLGRFHVYKEVMEKLGLPVDEQHVRIGQKRAEEGGFIAMNEILKAAVLPDAVFAGYDHMAIGAIFAIEQAGLRIPEDVAVLGFDDILTSKFIHKGLTTIKNPCEDMIAIALRVLLRRTEKPNTAPQQIALKPSLIIRGTT